MSRLCLALLAPLLIGCGSTPVRTNADGTYSVAAQYGSVNGSWDRASRQANEKAVSFCNERSQGVVVLSETQDGVYGFTPQRKELRFSCSKESLGIKDVSSGTLEVKLQSLKNLFDSGLLTKEQYDAQVSKELNSIE